MAGPLLLNVAAQRMLIFLRTGTGFSCNGSAEKNSEFPNPIKQAPLFLHGKQEIIEKSSNDSSSLKNRDFFVSPWSLSIVRRRLGVPA